MVGEGVKFFLVGFSLIVLSLILSLISSLVKFQTKLNLKKLAAQLAKFATKFAIIIFLFSFNAYANLFDDLVEQGKSDFRRNPAKVFHGFVYSTEDVNPSFLKKSMPVEWRLITKYPIDDIAEGPRKWRVSFGSDIAADLSSIINYSLKLNLVREDFFFPEMNISLTHLFYVDLYSRAFQENFFREVLKDINFQSVSAAYILAKSLTYNLKLFGGYRYNYGDISLNVPREVGLGENGELGSLSNFRDSWHLHTLILGVTHLIDKSNWEISSYLGYSFLEQDIYLKFDATYGFVSFGIGYYPSNVFIIKPHVKFLWRI